VVFFWILLDGAKPRNAGTTRFSSPVRRRGGQQDPLGISVVVHAHDMPKQGSRRDWIIAVTLGCFISLCTSSFDDE